MARASRSVAWFVALALFLALSVQPTLADDTPPPETVTIPGTLQSKVGCPADWQPGCDRTFLVYDAEDDVWQASFDLPADSYEYKAALNGSWEENYGGDGARNGANIPLVVAEPRAVKFFYDHKTHWVADNINETIATAVGTFQSEIGCAADNDPGCLRSWLQDPDGDGTYAFVSTAIPAGSYEARIALNESAEGTLGEGGTPEGATVTFSVPTDGQETYIGFEPETGRIVVSAEGAPRGNIGKPQAYWVAADTIAWEVFGSPRYQYQLHFAPEGGLSVTANGVEGGESIDLTFVATGPGDAALAKFPHLAGLSGLKLDEADLARVPEILKGQLALSVRDDDGEMVDATGLQIPGVLDDLFFYEGALGVTWESDVPTLRVWAPTARSVTLHRFADGNPATASTTQPMAADAATGTWSVTGDPSWRGQFYLYEVEVWVPSTGQIERNLVTDPYSLSLAANSTRSQIVELADPALAPEGWATLAKPELLAPEDIVLYELHVRDFSARDATVPAELRGTFAAFTQPESAGMQHLRALAEAGLTHIHLLPAFDIATINETAAERQEADPAQLAALPADSEEQQALLAPLRDLDGFNWGYDPYHYTVPEGSYSTNPDGPTRIREFRDMVAALNGSGLRVVMDVVYNHTNASGQNPRSVLDRIVPGYYHRLNGEGAVETSTCCQNTATEHAMMEKLMVDSLLTWARAYRVDGFRFDLMGHHMRANMERVRAALDELTLEADGVDGRQIYVYGEGWNFGEVADNARGVNATQENVGGLGIGTFNDRLRDAVRGGGPFSGLQEQGFVNGLLYQPNDTPQGTEAAQRARLLEFGDQIRVGLAGNLADFSLVDAEGERVAASDVDYRGAPTGYTLDPQEHIVYVSAHDNETLWDAIQLKAPPAAPVAERVRMHNLALAITAFSQGVPFFHAGDDLLRSKSLDRNSYNSGDWFNAIDWTGQTTNWAIGLPPADNQSNWPVMQPLLANPALRPTPADVALARDAFREMLSIRRSSPLFRLQTAEAIQQRVGFLNVGPEQAPGLIAMTLADDAANLDPTWNALVVVFNATPQEQTIADPALAGLSFALHPVQAASADPVVRAARADGETLIVPARTTAVFVSDGQLPLAEIAAEPQAQATAPAEATAEAPTDTDEATAEAQPDAAATPATADEPGERGGLSLPIVAGVGVALLALVVALRARRRG